MQGQSTQVKAVLAPLRIILPVGREDLYKPSSAPCPGHAPAAGWDQVRPFPRLQLPPDREHWHLNPPSRVFLPCGARRGAGSPGTRLQRQTQLSLLTIPAALTGSHCSPRSCSQGQGSAQQLRQGFSRKGCLCNSHLPGSFPAPACMFCQPWK